VTSSGRTGGPADRETSSLCVGRRALEQGRLRAPSGSEDETVLVPSGRPAEEHEVAIVDADLTIAVGEGVVGEIWVASQSVARGYCSAS